MILEKEINALMQDVEDVNESGEQLLSMLPRCAQIRRFQSHYGRAYAVLGGGYKIPMYCHGLTTWLDKCGDGRNEIGLKKFSQTHGLDTERYMTELADFGTLGHIMIGEFLTTRQFLTGWHFERRVYDYMLQTGMPLWKHKEYTDKMAMFMHSIGCFIYERNVEPFALEYPVCDFEKGIATCIDLICEMDDLDKQGNFKGRINATVNFKVRLNPNSYEKDEAQTNIEMFILQDLLINELTRLPKENQNIHKTFILCPKNLTDRTREEYLLTDMTGKYTRKQYSIAHDYRVENGMLDVNLDKPIPKYRNVLLIAGQKPQYETLRERMNDMFL